MTSAYGTSETCSTCGQPDNCGDCNHTPLATCPAKTMATVTGSVGATVGTEKVQPDGSYAKTDVHTYARATDTCTVCSVGDKHGNVIALEGADRCDCGCKYWENDRCIDCGTPVTSITKET
jgi:hypothetical protein